MSRFSLGRAAMALVLVAAGILIGATMVAPALAGTGGKAVATTQSRAVSCHAYNFHPVSSGMAYNFSEDAYIYPVGIQHAAFACAVDLPQRAVITKVQFTVWDDDDDGWLDNCSLRQSGLTVGGAAGVHTIAEVDTPSAHQDPGTVRASTMAIDSEDAVVNNNYWAYYLWCDFYGNAGSYTGLFGANVQFKITAANG